MCTSWIWVQPGTMALELLALIVVAARKKVVSAVTKGDVETGLRTLEHYLKCGGKNLAFACLFKVTTNLQQ